MDDNIELMHNCDKNHSCNFTSFLSAKENNKMVKIGDFCTEQAGCTVYILEKWFPLQGERAHSLNVVVVCMYVNRKEEE